MTQFFPNNITGSPSVIRFETFQSVYWYVTPHRDFFLNSTGRCKEIVEPTVQQNGARVLRYFKGATPTYGMPRPSTYGGSIG